MFKIYQIIWILQAVIILQNINESSQNTKTEIFITNIFNIGTPIYLSQMKFFGILLSLGSFMALDAAENTWNYGGENKDFSYIYPAMFSF